MELRSVAARRPSSSSMSSASGYDSSVAGKQKDTWVSQSGPYWADEYADDNTAKATCSVTGDEDDDELIPTAIVIKNIPFAIKKEQLLDVIAKLNLPLPYAFNYHFDNGVFRGLAFANFTSVEETTAVVNQLNGREIGGRKLRVEYKKMLPQQERDRIEREKREKRGQLEEQHRNTSNVSLNSLNSTQSRQFMSPQPMQAQSTGGSLLSATASQSNVSTGAATGMGISSSGAPPVSAGPAAGPSTERFYAPVTMSMQFPQLDYADPEVLEVYTQLVLFKDRERLYHEVAFPLSLSSKQKMAISTLLPVLGLVEVFDPSFIVIKRRSQDNSLARSSSYSSLRFARPSSTPNPQPPNFPTQSPRMVHARLGQPTSRNPYAQSMGTPGTLTQNAMSQPGSLAQILSGQPPLQQSSQMAQPISQSMSQSLSQGMPPMSQSLNHGMQSMAQPMAQSLSQSLQPPGGVPSVQVGALANQASTPIQHQSSTFGQPVQLGQLGQMPQNSLLSQQPLAPQHTSNSVHSMSSQHFFAQSNALNDEILYQHHDVESLVGDIGGLSLDLQGNVWS